MSVIIDLYDRRVLCGGLCCESNACDIKWPGSFGRRGRLVMKGTDSLGPHWHTRSARMHTRTHSHTRWSAQQQSYKCKNEGNDDSYIIYHLLISILNEWAQLTRKRGKMRFLLLFTEATTLINVWPVPPMAAISELQKAKGETRSLRTHQPCRQITVHFITHILYLFVRPFVGTYLSTNAAFFLSGSLMPTVTMDAPRFICTK